MTQTAPSTLLAGTWLTWGPDSLPPSRRNRHIPLLAWIVERLHPRLTVEIGVGVGESFRPLCQLAERYGDRSRVVGVDSWHGDGPGDWAGRSRYDLLAEYCATHHPEVASLVRTDPAEAVRDLTDASIDLLHIAAPVEGVAATFDPSVWLAKVRPGGVVLVTSADELRQDGDTAKVWAQVSEGLPAVIVEVPAFAGIVQLPEGGGTPLVDILRSDTGAATALFRLLGERIEFRHSLGSEPIGPAGVQSYLATQADGHAAAVRRLEAQHEVARHSMEERLASTYDRLVEASSELGRARYETDYLLAKLADQGARIEALEAAHAAELLALEDKLTQQGHRYNALERHAADQQAHISSMQATVSWRVTRPLRLVQRLRRKLRRSA